MENEYVVFTDKTASGQEIELAVVEEFEYERKYYVACSLVENDEIDETNVFIYRMKLKGTDDYYFEKITDPKEFEKVSNAYLEME